MQAPEAATPPRPPVTIPHPASYHLLPSVRPRDLAHLRPMSSQHRSRLCLSGWPRGKQNLGMGGPTMRIRSCQTCLGSKAYAYPASRSGRRAGHETKQTRSRGGRATDSGAPSTCLPSCGPAANCGAAVGTRHEAHKFPRRCCPHRVGTRCCWLRANATSLQPPA